MPTFNVIVPEGRLSSEQKTRVAVAVGRTYKELTVAPENLTQVIFIEVKHGSYLSVACRSAWRAISAPGAA